MCNKANKKYKDNDFYVVERKKDANDDIHFLIGKRNNGSEKMHAIVDIKTGEIRIEDNQIIGDDVAEKITTIIKLPNGKIIRTDRSAVSEEPEEQNTLNYFIFLLDHCSWIKDNINHEEIWFSSKNFNFQIKRNFVDNNFIEPWARVYPDKLTSRYFVYLYLNGSPIKEITFISCDGGRIFVSLPDIEFRGNKRYYYWDKNSIGYKIMKIVGEYYIYNNIEGVAKRSRIIIK